MRIVFFAQSFAIFTALAMIAVFAVPFILEEYGTVSIVMRFLQFEALALALGIGVAIFVPMYFGILKGEKVLLITTDPVRRNTVIKIATALESGKLNEDIKIQMGKKQYTGTVESYSGIITPARISLRPEKNIEVI